MDDRLYPTRPILAASTAVFRDGLVLIARRARAPMAGVYSLPGGAVEVGETLREAAARELVEEVGVEADILAFIDHVEPIVREGDQRARAFRHRRLRRPLAARRGAPQRRGRRGRLDRSESDRRLSHHAGAAVDRRQGGGDREKPAVKRILASSLAAFAALAVAVAPLAAQAQTAGSPPKPAAPAAKPTRRRDADANADARGAAALRGATPAPGRVVGALTYLRDLCGDGDGAAFRAKFADLVGAEGTTDARKESLAGAFNRGFRDYELTYRACTPTAREIVARFLDEAGRIAKDVANRYSG